MLAGTLCLQSGSPVDKNSQGERETCHLDLEGTVEQFRYRARHRVGPDLRRQFLELSVEHDRL